jgi:pimeloyl-ACP methyl ester carboxylesterase
LRPRGRLIAAGNTELFIREWGDEGPPILFWHALGDHTSMQMVEAAPILVEEFGYRVIGVDAPGFGGSPRLPDQRYEIPALVDLARDLLDVFGLERPAWSGSSWGAIVGLHLTSAHPDRIAALVLLDGAYLHTSEGKTLDELKEHWREQQEFRYETWEALNEDARRYFGRWSPALEAGTRSAFQEQDGAVVSIMGPDVYSAAIYGVEQSPPWDSFEQLGRNGVPVLLIAATEPPDQAERREAALERVAEAVPQASIERFEGASHFLLEARPEETARAVGEWLRTLGYA